ncbi:MAG: alpha-mannosidase, partial [Spirochaetales bacterium]|nr:alpha-mannosidase [Spirochaetales bacterium]
SGHALMAFGIGDGGGGPGAEHLERLERMKYTADPSHVNQRKVSRFFTDWAGESDLFPIWEGELYLEKHQGTYTTEAKSKWYNRKMEHNLRRMELFSVLAMIYTSRDISIQYPADKLEQIWKEVLLYQFHDILPGSSIKRVYDESWKRYSTILTDTELYIEKAETNLLIAVGFDPVETDTGNNDESTIIVFNSLSWEVSKWIFFKNNWARITIPSIGYAVETVKEEDTGICEFKWTESFMENELITLKFANDGSLLSVFDKEIKREVLVPGQRGNMLLVYDDLGDAWDFPSNYRKSRAEQFALVESSIIRNGPELINHQIYRYEESILTQDVVLTSNDRRIDFRTNISWLTPAKMVRTSFPVDIPEGKAMCEIQFGAIERPMNSDTSWDMAKDEISSHRWIDISNDNFGVALLNDSKYGHRTKDSILDINLLRSVPYPGPVEGYTDMIEHEFTYSLFSHKGNFSEGRVVQAAHELNSSFGVYQVKKTINNLSRSFFSTGDSSLIISTIKKAENSNDVIVRLYESAGKNISTCLESEIFKPQFSSSVSPVKAILVNLLEEFQEPLEIIDSRIIMKAKPYEIISIRLSFIN